ncbi:MAG: hypothetical protein AVDCRST_MAG11-3813, partial [uncultured Gemmatimonadaceae bacterium]
CASRSRGPATSRSSTSRRARACGSSIRPRRRRPRRPSPTASTPARRDAAPTTRGSWASRVGRCRPATCTCSRASAPCGWTSRCAGWAASWPRRPRSPAGATRRARRASTRRSRRYTTPS